MGMPNYHPYPSLSERIGTDLDSVLGGIRHIQPDCKWIVSQGEKVPWNRKPTPPLHNPQKWGLSIWVSLAAFQLSTLAVPASPFPSCLHFVLLCFFNMSVPISLFLLHLDSKSSLRVSFLHSVTIIGPCYRQCCELQDSKSGFSTVFNIVIVIFFCIVRGSTLVY